MSVAGAVASNIPIHLSSDTIPSEANELYSR
jgi:hypothetical protein